MLFLGQVRSVLLDNQFIFRIGGQVFPFMWIFAQVIELTGAVEVLDEAVAGAADRIIAQSKTSDR